MASTEEPPLGEDDRELLLGWANEFNSAVDEVAEVHRQVPGLLTYEEDLRMHLGARLLARPMFCDPLTTKDGSLSTRLHAQVQWFPWVETWGEGGRTFPDFTVLEPSNLRIREDEEFEFLCESKNCQFDGPAMVIELKLLKGDGTLNGYLQQIADDAEKLNTLLRRFNDVFVFQVVFSKYIRDPATVEARMIPDGELARRRFINGTLQHP